LIPCQEILLEKGCLDNFGTTLSLFVNVAARGGRTDGQSHGEGTPKRSFSRASLFSRGGRLHPPLFIINLRSPSKGVSDTSITGKTYFAHRVSYETKNGFIPHGKFVLHHCDSRNCVNPDHLFIGIASDNSLDMVRKGRMPPNSGVR
jgi:hypothetical protein